MMLHAKDVYRAFRDTGVNFFTGVPDSLLKDICAYITDTAGAGEHVITANEGGAVALAMGHYLATGEPAVVYLQNSGLGNTVNPLLSLADREVYGIPMIVMVGWRGEPGRPDEPQHVKQGRVMLGMLDTMGYPYFILDADTADPTALIARCCDEARQRMSPVALVVRAGTFAPYALKDAGAPELPLTREGALGRILDRLGEDTVVVSTTGKASREVFEYRAVRGQGHHRDFLTVGGMGHASMIALGIALRRPDRPVICLDGDGAVLMHMGALSTIGLHAPPNFRHVVLNNASHDSVGGQPTAGFDVDLCAVALACGYAAARVAGTTVELDAEADRLLASDGPALLEVRVRRGARSELGRPTTSPAENRRALMAWLGAHHPAPVSR
jgi:phosphonopyruvate decarboxylase